MKPQVVSESEIEKISGLKSNTEGVAVVQQKKALPINFETSILYLDGVSDPGNLGTIIRTADWFGISQVVCASNCVEFYNPKTIQSTMGSFVSLVPIVMDVESFIKLKPKSTPVFLAEMEGEHPSALNNKEPVVLVMGSESHGVSNHWKSISHQSITIPQSALSKAESLNVGVATSILCYILKSRL